MEQPFLALYHFFDARKTSFRATLALVVALLTVGALRVDLEEDISRFFPDDERVEKLNLVFQHSRLAERIVLMVSVRDSSTRVTPDRIVRFALDIADSMKRSPHVKNIRARVDDSRFPELLTTIRQHLPVYLTDADYAAIDSLQDPQVAANRLISNLRQLLSPGSAMLKEAIVNDPLGFSFPVYNRLRGLQFDDAFELYDGHIITKDRRHALVFLETKYAANDTRGNAKLLRDLDAAIAASSRDFPQLTASYFGGPVVAVGNAAQLQRDTIVTVSIMIVILAVALIAFFRRKRVPFLILLPVAIGALFSLAVIGVVQGSLSILALAVGAVILGVAVDYSLHFLVHLKEIRNTPEVIRQLARPLTIGSLTTVLAFLFLQLTNASVLRDIGLFAGLSLVGAALSSLIFLPHLVSPDTLGQSSPRWIGKFSSTSWENRRWLVYVILLLTPVFLYFATQVKFNSDMSRLNFMDDRTKAANERLETLNKASLSSVMVVSSGASLEDALRRSEKMKPILDELLDGNVVDRVSTVSRFLISDSLQNARLEKWRAFWTDERKEKYHEVLRTQAAQLGFSKVIVNNFDSLLSRQYERVRNDSTNIFRQTFFNDYVIEREGQSSTIAMASSDPARRPQIYQRLEGSGSTAVDRQLLTNLFVEYVHADFSLIVNITSVLVFVALLISFGRIELTLITFVPMLITWVWILGLMALLGIEFNIVNVMVSTFIFGLGDDYSIFIMDGLQNEYSSGSRQLPAIRTSIFLSAFTTVTGLGVLIFAEHPALRSIAAISIIGIICVFVMALVLQPFFFRSMISDRAKRGQPPLTMLGILKTFYTYAFFVAGSFLLTIIGLVLKLIPFGRKKVKLFFHYLIQKFTAFNLFMAFNLKLVSVGRRPDSFSKPSVLIANHSSFLDILLTTSLHPRLILLTNRWVYRSPVFGGVVRLADYYPVMEGAEGSIAEIGARVAEGYSVVVFPEGTRSADGVIGRFHKGAFFIAEKLGLPIQPLLIHGAGDGIRKGDMYLNDSTITLKFLPSISAKDHSFGLNYSERARHIGRYFRDEFAKLKREGETPSYFRYWLFSNYLYKGPVLEWYMRVKVALEKNYEAFDRLIPANAKVLDLGCGYGFLCYMLQFLSKDRIIAGVDYDADKIAVASSGYLKTDRLDFQCADVTKFPTAGYDVIVISDVLHYLSPAEQDDLVDRCFDSVNEGGKVIIRDGNRDLQERHRGTKATEFFSVKILRFNKSRNALNFISGKELTAKAQARGLSVEMQDNSRLTSNVIFVISKPKAVHAEI